MRAVRLVDAPIVGPDSDRSIGANIQGPSLIRAPDWLPNRLGRYYLYFADHKGSYIRLAFADDLAGPWRVHPSGSLTLAQSCFPTEPPELSPEALRETERGMKARGVALVHDVVTEMTTPHIASPDVHVDEARRRIIMYFHGLEGPGEQVSRVALSDDGVAFATRREVLGRSYMRIFRYRDMTWALSMPGQFYRSREPLGGFEAGPVLFNANMRHSAVLRRGDTLHVFWTQVGHVPERILHSTVDLRGDWSSWRESPAVEVLRPERSWEGAREPLRPSIRGVVHDRVNQLRDPAIFEQDGAVYLLYAVAGESGIGIARLSL